MTFKQNDIWMSCIAALAEADNIDYYEAEKLYGQEVRELLEKG